MKRSVRAAFGCGALLLVGLVYAWSVLQAPIAASYPEWTATDLSFGFTIMMCAFCIGGSCGGFLQRRISSNALIVIAAVITFIGLLVASRASSLLQLYGGLGVLVGFASGVMYNVIIGTVTAWFPDKQALISGVLLMAFGMSGFILGKAYAALTPSDGSDSWRTSLVILGAISFVALAACSFALKKPDATHRPAQNGDSPNNAQKGFVEDVGASVMIRRPAFWLLFIWGALLMMAGLEIISQATNVLQEIDVNISASDGATLVGLLSIFNGIGRVGGGFTFEKLGQLRTMLAAGIFVIAGFVLIGLTLGGFGGTPLLAIGFVLVGYGYGNVAPCISAIVYRLFGPTNYALNYSLVIFNGLVASFGSTFAGILKDLTGSYSAMAVSAIALAVASLALALLIREPKRQSAD